MIITATPLRIPFFGGVTDCPEACTEQGVSVLSATINKYSYISCRFLPPIFEYRSSVIHSQVERVQSNRDIQHPTIRACLEYLGIEEGIEINNTTDLPGRTGLGNTSSLVVGLLHALYALKGKMLDKHSLAHEASYITSQIADGADTILDTLSITYGGFNRINVTSDKSVDVRRIVTAQLRITEFQNRCMLFFIGYPNDTLFPSVGHEYIPPSNQSDLSTISQLVSEGENVISDSRLPLDDFGKLLHENWILRRPLVANLTASYVDSIYETGLRAGALGGSLLSTSGGGYMLFYVPVDKQQAVKECLKSLLHVPFSFMNRGTQVLLYEPETKYDARPSAPGTRLNPHMHSPYPVNSAAETVAFVR